MPTVLYDNLIGRNLIPYPVLSGSINSSRIFDIAPFGPVKPAASDFIFLHQPIFDWFRFDLKMWGIFMAYTVRYSNALPSTYSILLVLLYSSFSCSLSSLSLSTVTQL